MDDTQTKRIGRPPDYREDEFCVRIVELGALGYSQAQMAADIGVCKATITQWAQKHQAFSNALARARTLSQSWWERQAQENLASRDFNAALWTQNVKSRFRDDYMDRVVHAGDPESPLEIKDSNGDARRVAFMLGRAIGRQDRASTEKQDS